MTRKGGRYVGQRFPFLDIHREIQGQTVAVAAMVDSGFAGGVALPRGAFAPNSPQSGVFRWLIADGRIVESPVFTATLLLGPFDPLPVDVAVMGRVPLLGCAVLNHFTVVLDPGRRIVVQL